VQGEGRESRRTCRSISLAAAASVPQPSLICIARSTTFSTLARSSASGYSERKTNSTATEEKVQKAEFEGKEEKGQLSWRAMRMIATNL
jgi:hypothetical protein